MQNIQQACERDIFIQWFAPFGKAAKLLVLALNPSNAKGFDWRLFRAKSYWMGVKAFPLISISAVFVSLALTLQTVLEMRAFRTQDLSGAIIAIGLLRELGPITISLAWSARVAAHLCAEGRNFGYDRSDSDYASHFVLPNLLAGLIAAVPLSAYGLVIGFLSAALFAPTLGVSSTDDFLETARLYIHQKDVVTYFVKLILINPTIAVLVGSAFARDRTQLPSYGAANAVTATFITGFTVNWLTTYAVFFRP